MHAQHAIRPVADVIPQGRRRDLPPLKAPLPPDEAARRFVAWMQDHGFAGEHRWAGPNGLWEHYLWHCHEIRRHRVPDNLFGEALDALAPRSRPRIPDPVTGRPIKVTVYRIPDAEPEMAEVVPLAPKLARQASASRAKRPSRDREMKRAA